MSAPIGRETPARKAETRRRQVASLARRPAPEAAAGTGGEWAYLWRTADKTYTSGSPDGPFDASTTGAQSDSSVLQAYAASELIEVKATGIYLATFAGSWTTSYTGDKLARIGFGLNNIVAPDFAEQMQNELGGYFHVCCSVIADTISAGTPPGINYINAVLSQSSGTSKTMQEAMLHVVRVAVYP